VENPDISTMVFFPFILAAQIVSTAAVEL